MNRKELILLLLGVTVIGAVSLGVFKRNASSWQQTNSAQGKVLNDFALNEVAQIEIKSAQSDLNLIKKDNRWCVKERANYPASFEQVSDLVRKLWELKAVQTVDVGPSQLGRLNLLEPGPDAKSAGTVVDLKDTNGVRIRALLVGKKYLRETPGMDEGQGYPAGRYVMALGPERQPVLVGDALTQTESSAAQWLDHDFFKVEHIKSVAVTGTSAETSWKLSRETETSDWKLADLKSGEELDQGKVPVFASQLAFPAFADVQTQDQPLDNPTSVEVETFNGFTYSLKFGSSSIGDNLPMKIAISANLATERPAGKDEKPEEKKRLDEQFAANAKELQSKLEKEKQLEPRTFLVAKGGFESFFKKRSELMAEKKTAQAK